MCTTLLELAKKEPTISTLEAKLCEHSCFYFIFAHKITLGRGTIRLFRNGTFSSSYSSGIVQIYYGRDSFSTSSWGNICDDESFGSTEANVICNQLGYNGASTHGRAGSTSRYTMNIILAE